MPLLIIVSTISSSVAVRALKVTVIVPLYLPSGLAVISNEPAPSSPYFDGLKLLTVTLFSKSDTCEFRLINA